ncbi:putative F-box/LRR-repeat protein 9 [Lolium perenne]|uniref:putative F-box/LRR-repeat protein 9 n=1 Tax=Lolium perenne TaxID=4522 RepID=UPI0021EAB65E|nr:putative F-box/LRR-repeat protein 9 [Lolium perenne]
MHLDLPWSAEQRNWAALPRDVLCIILSFVPQADILRGAGFVCASWRRLAQEEPLLWRRIDLAAATDENEDAPARWQAMARAAVLRSAGRCESFRGRVNGKFLLFLAHSAPSLRSIHVTSRFTTSSNKLIRVVAKKLSLLEQLVLSDDGLIYREASLAAFVEHCPRVELLDSGRCLHLSDRTLRTMVESSIKDLRRTGRFRGP